MNNRKELKMLVAERINGILYYSQFIFRIIEYERNIK